MSDKFIQSSITPERHVFYTWDELVSYGLAYGTPESNGEAPWVVNANSAGNRYQIYDEASGTFQDGYYLCKYAGGTDYDKAYRFLGTVFTGYNVGINNSPISICKPETRCTFSSKIYTKAGSSGDYVSIYPFFCANGVLLLRYKASLSFIRSIAAHQFGATEYTVLAYTDCTTEDINVSGGAMPISTETRYTYTNAIYVSYTKGASALTSSTTYPDMMIQSFTPNTNQKYYGLAVNDDQITGTVKKMYADFAVATGPYKYYHCGKSNRTLSAVNNGQIPTYQKIMPNDVGLENVVIIMQGPGGSGSGWSGFYSGGGGGSGGCVALIISVKNVPAESRVYTFGPESSISWVINDDDVSSYNQLQAYTKAQLTEMVNEYIDSHFKVPGKSICYSQSSASPLYIKFQSDCVKCAYLNTSGTEKIVCQANKGGNGSAASTGSGGGSGGTCVDSTSSYSSFAQSIVALTGKKGGGAGGGTSTAFAATRIMIYSGNNGNIIDLDHHFPYPTDTDISTYPAALAFKKRNGSSGADGNAGGGGGPSLFAKGGVGGIAYDNGGSGGAGSNGSGGGGAGWHGTAGGGSKGYVEIYV